MFRSKPVLATLAALVLFLSGCGGGGTVSSSSPTLTPALSFSATSFTFPSTTIGQTSTAQTLTLTSTGSASVVFTAAIALGDSTNFGIASNTCTTTLAAGTSCAVTLVFKPQTVASLSTSIVLTDNVAGSPQTVTLSGIGTAAVVPQASLSTSTIVFPATAANVTSAAQIVTLTNPGNGPLSIGGIVLGGADFLNFYESNNCSTTLAAGASCIISATVTPNAPSTAYNATVTITDNANNIANSTQVITLSETSSAPVAAPTALLNPGVLTFPSTTVNTSGGNLSVSLSNPGTAALTGITLSITGGVSSSAFTIAATTCGASLAIGANCNISVNFTPTLPGTYTAYLNVADNASGSPQQVTLNGTATAVPAPVATLSSTSISFPITTVGTTTSAYSVTLSNTGSATLNIAGIALTGATANLTKSTNCLATLAAGASCTISSTFNPSAATTYTGAITITDNNSNVANSTQTISISGTGTTATVSYQLYVLPDPGTGSGSGMLSTLYALVNNAQKSIDLVMYAMQDTTFTGDLVAACQRGVKVRAIFDQNLEKSRDTPAYNQLNAQTNCSAVWANKAFGVTHQKAFIVDGTQLVLMSLNLEAQYYSTTRDFAMVYNDTTDIAAVQATFNADYAAGTPASGVAGASDFSYVPATGNDLIWSPTTAQAAMESIINNATTTLLIDAEELTSSAGYIATDIANACKRGVTVRFTLENQSGSYNAQLATIKAGGCSLPSHFYSSSTGYYVHAKAVIADYGLATQKVYMGSINYSNASMNSNRELGMYITDNASVQLLYTSMLFDYNNATGTY